eukprot:g465.t1
MGEEAWQAYEPAVEEVVRVKISTGRIGVRFQIANKVTGCGMLLVGFAEEPGQVTYDHGVRVGMCLVEINGENVEGLEFSTIMEKLKANRPKQLGFSFRNLNVSENSEESGKKDVSNLEEEDLSKPLAEDEEWYETEDEEEYEVEEDVEEQYEVEKTFGNDNDPEGNLDESHLNDPLHFAVGNFVQVSVKDGPYAGYWVDARVTKVRSSGNRYDIRADPALTGDFAVFAGRKVPKVSRDDLRLDHKHKVQNVYSRRIVRMKVKKRRKVMVKKRRKKVTSSTNPNANSTLNENDDLVHVNLPKGWRTKRSKLGDVYFVNEYTKESTWDRPTAPALKRTQSEIEKEAREAEAEARLAEAEAESLSLAAKKEREEAEEATRLANAAEERAKDARLEANRKGSEDAMAQAVAAEQVAKESREKAEREEEEARLAEVARNEAILAAAAAEKWEEEALQAKREAEGEDVSKEREEIEEDLKKNESDFDFDSDEMDALFAGKPKRSNSNIDMNGGNGNASGGDDMDEFFEEFDEDFDEFVTSPIAAKVKENVAMPPTPPQKKVEEKKGEGTSQVKVQLQQKPRADADPDADPTNESLKVTPKAKRKSGLRTPTVFSPRATTITTLSTTPKKEEESGENDDHLINVTPISRAMVMVEGISGTQVKDDFIKTFERAMTASVRRVLGAKKPPTYVVARVKNCHKTTPPKIMFEVCCTSDHPGAPTICNATNTCCIGNENTKGTFSNIMTRILKKKIRCKVGTKPKAIRADIATPVRVPKPKGQGSDVTASTTKTPSTKKDRQSVQNSLTPPSASETSQNSQGKSQGSARARAKARANARANANAKTKMRHTKKTTTRSSVRNGSTSRSPATTRSPAQSARARAKARAAKRDDAKASAALGGVDIEILGSARARAKARAGLLSSGGRLERAMRLSKARKEKFNGKPSKIPNPSKGKTTEV